MRLAKRLSVIEPSMTLKVTAKAAELRAAGVDVVSFGAGEPDFDTPAHIKEAAKKALDAGATKYTAVEGTPQLRKAAAIWMGKAHGFEISPKEVIVTAGAKQAIFNAFHVVLEEGDEVIIPKPYFVEYHFYVDNFGGVCKLVPTTSDFNLDLAAIEAALAAK